MKSSVIIFPGSNCDRDMDVALKKFGFENQMVWHNDAKIPKSDLIVLPGGFSYGDYLRCGSIAGKSRIIKSVIDFANSGGLVLGICNGFQILTETGLLPGILQQNKYLNFICKNVFVKIKNKENKYFKKIKKEVLELHIAHNEGNYFCSKEQIKEFIKDRFNRSLESIGIKKVFETNISLLNKTEWFNDEIIGTKHGDNTYLF